MFQAGHGTSPDLIYASGATNAPTPNPTSFDKKQCTLVIVDIDFCRNLGCDLKIEKNTKKYPPLIAALRRYRGRDEFIAFPIGGVCLQLPRIVDSKRTHDNHLTCKMPPHLLAVGTRNSIDPGPAWRGS